MVEVHESELRILPRHDDEVVRTLGRLKATMGDARPRLVDTTMLYAPRSGGVKRYLLAKQAWLGRVGRRDQSDGDRGG